MSYLTPIEGIVKEHGSQQKVAEILGVTPAFLSDVLNKKRRVSKGLAHSLESNFQLDARAILQAQLDEEYQDYEDEQK